MISNSFFFLDTETQTCTCIYGWHESAAFTCESAPERQVRQITKSAQRRNKGRAARVVVIVLWSSPWTSWCSLFWSLPWSLDLHQVDLCAFKSQSLRLGGGDIVCCHGSGIIFETKAFSHQFDKKIWRKARKCREKHDVFHSIVSFFPLCSELFIKRCPKGHRAIQLHVPR